MASIVDELPLVSVCVRASVEVAVSEPSGSLEVASKDDVASTASLPLTPLTVDVDASSEVVWVLAELEMAPEVDSTTLSEVDRDVPSVDV